MNSNKKKALEESYERIINVGFCIVPYEDLSNLFVEDPVIFGTTKDERIFSFEGVKELFESQFEQMKGIQPTLSRNRLATHISPDGNSAFIVEENTLTLTSPEEINSIFLRISCVMEYMDNRWKLTHWHASTPVDTENDHWHQEEWKREKEKLQKLVDEQTANLQVKNRELEIEAALERVRARTMAMQHSDELMETSELMFEQIKNLGIELWSCGFSLWYDDDSYFLGYNPGPDGKMGEPLKIPLTEDDFFITIREAKRRGDEFLVFESDGKSLEDTYRYMDTLPVVGETMRGFVEAGYPLPTYQVTHCGFFSNGHLMFITQERNPEAVEIFKQFTNVFNQTYTRFLDLQKAEAQAREAKIEAALEKVRSRTMAMQHSEDLSETSAEMFRQIQELGLEQWSCGFNIFDHENNTITQWVSSGDGRMIPPFKTPSDEDVFSTITEAFKKDKSFISIEMSGEDLAAHYDYMSSLPVVGEEIAALKESGIEVPEHQVLNVAFFEHGYLLFITFEPVPEYHQTYKRFADVFNQTYTRFLDLKKAEAQARESQIELSLERIRAQVTAMQESSDLFDIVVKMRSEFVALGHKADYFWHMRWQPEVYEMSMTSEDGSRIGMVINVPKFVHDEIPELADWERGDEPIFVLALDADDARDYIENMNTHGHYEKADPHAPTREDIEHIGGLTFVIARTTHGEIGFSLPGVVPDPPRDALETLVRFAGVFDLAYKRFEDLKIKENQHREAQIELALEKVRSRTMAMQNSEELADAAFVLFEQLRELGGNLWGTGFGLCEKDSDRDSFWFANENGVFPPVSIPNTTDPAHQQMYEGWKAGLEFLAIEASGKELKNHYDYMLSQPEVKPFFQKILDEGLSFPEWQQWNAAYFKHGFLLIITLEPYPDPDILVRFAKVFEQTYTRFLDLKKAEVQAREAQIEAALERVRSRSMGMQKSDELIGVVREIGRGIQELGIQIHYSQIFTDYSDDPKTGINIWVDVEGLNYLKKFHIPYIDHSITRRFYNPLNEGQEFIGNQFSKSDKDSYFKLLFKHSDLKRIPEKRKELILEAPGWTRVTVIFKNSSLNFGRYSLNEFTNDEKEIFKRFGKVFGQAYTRFLDLKKAEAQAREAKIETALEKVRSRSLGMQKSEELNDVVKVLFEKMTELEVPSTAVGIQTFTEGSKDMQCFVCGDVGSGMVISQYLLPYFDHPILEDYHEAHEKDLDYYVGTYSKDEKDSFYDVVLKLPELKDLPAEVNDMIKESSVYEITMVPAKKSVMSVNDFYGNPLSESQVNILKRFAKVFDQAYIRFLDLQKVEKQAREAQIEAALERVRSRSMGMQKSTDLRSVVDTLYGEFKALGVDFHAVVIQLLLDDTKDMHMWITIGDGSYDNIIHWPYVDLPMFNAFYEARTGNKTFDYQTGSEAETREFFEEYFKLEVVPEERKEALKNVRLIDNIGTYQKHTGVFLMRYTEGEYSEKDQEIVRRFSRVFEQTYTRFLDLQKAEKQAAEAIKQASLDRVRGEIASMRSTDDLKNITPLIWNELKALDVPFIRCGVFIIQEKDEHIEVYLSKPDGSSLAVMHLPFDSNKLATQTVEAWRNREVFTQYWSREEFLEFGSGLMDQGQIPDLESYQGAEEAPESLYLHFIPFNQGMLYVGSTESLDDEEIILSESLAEAFSIAYARYEDFVKLEKAKAGIEEALSELKATQSQLVQQEKLASLGQLTAGIAHEIKNPLNFVNNFSDLSVELVEETKEELLAVSDQLSAEDKEKVEEALEILGDIEMNLRKIHEHGSRADSIVKSMLQHSRGSDGIMEPTDLNALLKEYVNLAFHGMRAGKNPINVDIELELDDNVGQIPLIAEDFSRVMVNLCNNAFDAMRKKADLKPEASDAYSPKLTVKTYRGNEQIIVEIEDNGPGIPEEMRGNIMQPFFTTKKGTEGTGLGLSITNDIIKAHGGALGVESKNSKGSTFIVRLPHPIKKL